MRSIYMDLRYAFGVSEKSGKFNGGYKGCQRLAQVMAQKKQESDELFFLVNPNMKETVKSVLQIDDSEYIEIDDLGSISAKDGDLLWIPLVNDCMDYAKELQNFRQNNEKVHISIHIHDRRHKYLKFDKEDSVLSAGIRTNPFAYYLGRIIHSTKIERALKIICSCADDVFTVSNYSMQCLNTIKQIKNINLYFQGIFSEESNKTSEDFLLFVSAGRPEKNFYRTLKAFIKYCHKNSKTTAKLVVTGLNDNQKEKVNSLLEDDSKQFVDLRGYVSERELNELYDTCRALIFTSKSEGFGMPVLEALFHHKPSVVSNMSSIPEVLGSIGTYVNPMDEDSIEKGIELIMDDNYYNSLIEFVDDRLEIVKRQISLDDEVLISRLLHY